MCGYRDNFMWEVCVGSMLLKEDLFNILIDTVYSNRGTMRLKELYVLHVYMHMCDTIHI